MSTSSNSEANNGQPDWLNWEYIEEAIRSHARDNTIKLVKLDIIPATAKGENYSSVMSRIRLEYVHGNVEATHKCSYILKRALDASESGAITSDTFASYHLFEDEMKIYDCIFPKLKDILHSIGCNEIPVPDPIKVDYQRTSIILEDLCMRDYVMAERKKGLSIEQSKLVLENLAQLHAASAVLNERSPGIFTDFDHGFFNRHTDMFGKFFNSQLELCAQVVSSWKGFECYGEKLFKLNSKLMEYAAETFVPKDHHLNVLIHGDLWTNNAMFKYNDVNEPIDAVLIDFQFSCWTSPTIDLHFFLNSSLAEDIKFNCTEELVQFYYTCLAKTLRRLKFSGRIPTLKEFWLQYMETSFCVVFVVCIFTGVVTNEVSGGGDGSSLMEDDDRAIKFKLQLYENVKVQNTLKHMLPILDRRGLLDIN